MMFSRVVKYIRVESSRSVVKRRSRCTHVDGQHVATMGLSERVALDAGFRHPRAGKDGTSARPAGGLRNNRRLAAFHLQVVSKRVPHVRKSKRIHAMSSVVVRCRPRDGRFSKSTYRRRVPRTYLPIIITCTKSFQYPVHESGDKKSKIAGGGEYTTQTGFGWTNGVVLELLAKHGNMLKYEES